MSTKIKSKDDVTISETLEVIKGNYSKEAEKDSISGGITGEGEEDKFPGYIQYDPPSSTISQTIIIQVDENGNITGIVEEPEVPLPAVTPASSEYTKVGKIYCNSPDLSGFNPESTYYVSYDAQGNNETIDGRIDRVSAPEKWYDYENKIWANVVTVTGNDVTYWVWVPRYKYNISSTDKENQTVDVKFVNSNDVCTMEIDGQDSAVDVTSYKLPDSFTFSGESSKNLKGYWISKYQIQLSESSGIERVRNVANGTKIKITTSNPIGTYKIYVQGVERASNVHLPYELTGLNKNTKYDICVVSETNGKMIGRTTGITTSDIEVDVSGFDPSHTYYVTYDSDGNNEKIEGRMDKITEPTKWYNYDNKVWANLATVNGDDVTYWTYIPRYEYKIYSNVNQKVHINYIPSTRTVPDSDYIIPDSFKFGNKELKGYWVSKYQLQLSEKSGIEKISSSTSGTTLTVTTTNPSGEYTVFLNGEKYEESVTLPYEIRNLNPNTEYDICLFSKTNGRIVGNTKGLTTSNIEVDLSGFDPKSTYYVTYDSSGNNEAVGSKIQLDDDGNATNMPVNWYNYDKKIWANVVTTNGGLETYWTYIPRYEYSIISKPSEKVNVKFIPSSQTEPNYGYEIPDSFKFGGKDLKGYWISKYQLQGTID